MRVNLCKDFHVLREGRYSLSQKGTAASSSHHLQIFFLMLQQAKESHCHLELSLVIPSSLNLSSLRLRLYNTAFVLIFL